MRPVIYDYPSFACYLAEYLTFCKREERAFSYRNLARKMGGTAPSLIAMIAKGQRGASPAFLHKFATAAKLAKREVEYAETLVGFERARSPKEKSVYTDRLRDLRPGAESVVISFDQFEFMARWHHVALLEMVSLKDFCADGDWLARRLGGKVSGKEASLALDRLRRLGLIAADAEGRLRKTSEAFKSPSGIPNSAIRGFHKEMLGLAAEAIDEQTVDERHVSAQTMTIKRTKLPEARRIIGDFLEKMRALVPDEDGDETYHFAVQLFKLTHDPERLNAVQNAGASVASPAIPTKPRAAARAKGRKKPGTAR